MIHIPGNQELCVTSGYSIGHCEVEYFTITECSVECFGCSSLGGTEAETVMERDVCLWEEVRVGFSCRLKYGLGIKSPQRDRLLEYL